MRNFAIINVASVVAPHHLKAILCRWTEMLEKNLDFSVDLYGGGGAARRIA